jgi:ribosomal protein L37AE/L43A
MPVKSISDYLCPACRNIVDQRTGDLKRRAWLKCDTCGMEGPLVAWEAMRKRRKALEESLDLSQLSSADRDYLKAIDDFGQKMYRELKVNAPENGNFLEWKPERQAAAAELEHRVVKLIAAVNRGRKTEVSEFAADLGNITMAIDKNFGTT